jgi:hypothetical protein
MKAFLVSSLAILLITGQRLDATEKPKKNLAWQFSERPSVAVAGKLFELASRSQQEQSMTVEEKAGKHSPVKAAVFSAVVPGAGQAYNKSWIKAAAFLAIEVGGWIGNRHYESEGDRLTGEFETFADAHWNAERYYNWLATRSGCQSGDLACLQEYERASFSHFLPNTKNQTYYENIGKYDQFNIGWDDATQGGERDSANRETYDFMRADANDQYSAATLLASAILLNHVVSAFDAAWTTNRYNKRIVQSSFGFIRSDNRRLTPALTLKVEW